MSQNDFQSLDVFIFLYTYFYIFQEIKYVITRTTVMDCLRHLISELFFEWRINLLQSAVRCDSIKERGCLNLRMQIIHIHVYNECWFLCNWHRYAILFCTSKQQITSEISWLSLSTLVIKHSASLLSVYFVSYMEYAERYPICIMLKKTDAISSTKSLSFRAIGIGMRSYFVHRNSKLLVKSLDCAEPLKYKLYTCKI
jgi:hypothetical protein